MLTLVLTMALLGQSSEDSLRANLAVVQYPLLAELARVQGDVNVRIEAGKTTLLSGHPLLTPAALESARQLTSTWGALNIDVTYHFYIEDTIHTVRRQKTTKRGNVLMRGLLRVVGAKTEKVVEEYNCENSKATPNVTNADGQVINVQVHGREFCIQTQQSYMIAQR